MNDAPPQHSKSCADCGNIKTQIERIRNGKLNYEYICKPCTKKKRQQQYENDKEAKLVKAKEYREENRERINLFRRGKYKETTKKYQAENKDAILANQRKSKKNRWKNDPLFRFQHLISASVRQATKRNGGSKNGASILDYLPYAIEELKTYIEILFSMPQNLTKDGKIWMTWKNWGKYNSKTWDDNNPSTWTWQLDHIMPQSTLPFDNFQHPNFLKCWGFDNLRPLNAKYNNADGDNRTLQQIEVIKQDIINFLNLSKNGDT